MTAPDVIAPTEPMSTMIEHALHILPVALALTLPVTEPREVAGYAHRIGGETRRLSGMVDDLFELSRITAGALQLTLSAVPLQDIVSDALAGQSPVAERKQVRLVANAQAWPVVLGSDPELA